MACSNVNTWQNHQDACGKFGEVGTQKIGLSEIDRKTEDYYTVKAEQTTQNTLGNEALYAGIGIAYAYKSYRNKAISFKLPTMGVADSVTNKVTTNSYTLNLTWKMPFLK
jgi:arginine/ornithine N-succinyltransferase beta subunit